MTGNLRLPVTLLHLLAGDAPEADLRAHLRALADAGAADPADLAGRRESDDLLAAICRRARQLLGTDVAYVTLRDPAHDDTFVFATDGVVSGELRTMRLPFGVGLGGLVAETGDPRRPPTTVSTSGSRTPRTSTIGCRPRVCAASSRFPSCAARRCSACCCRGHERPGPSRPRRSPTSRRSERWPRSPWRTPG